MRRPRNDERGATLIFVAVMFVMLVGFIALVVDIGKLHRTRGELQNASDSAAHAGATALDGTTAGITLARERAKAYALLNNANGSAVEVSDDDIEFGHWDVLTGVFTSLGTSPTNAAAVNAVRVLDYREAVPLDFATVLGRSSADVRSHAIAISGGPMTECGFPMVVPDCTLGQALADGSCAHCMTYQDNNTDNAGWTSFDS